MTPGLGAQLASEPQVGDQSPDGLTARQLQVRDQPLQREPLALQGLIAHLPLAETRVLLALWLLADRWGRATPDGTVLSLALTHELLGQLTGARRSPAADRLGEGAGNARQGLRCAPLETSRVRTGR